MQRYSINTPLVAVRLFRSHETEKAGVMTTLPAKAVVEILGPSDVGDGMVEVTWERRRYAVFERDLKVGEVWYEPLRSATELHQEFGIST